MIIIDEPLKPCPFCGSDGVMFEDLRYRSHPSNMWVVYGVKCSNPDCIMHQDQCFYPYKSVARKAWNKRAISALAMSSPVFPAPRKEGSK